MSRSNTQKRGFTLVELLVVIAIIGILASFTFVGMGRYFRMAKTTKTVDAIRQLETEMTAYYVDHKSYPPAYGFLTKDAFSELTPAERAALDPDDPAGQEWFVSEHYMYALELAGSVEHFDVFGLETSDTDYNNWTDVLEYYPVDAQGRPTGKDDDIDWRNNTVIIGQRPFIYVPVNLRQFRKMKKYWDENSDGFPDFHNNSSPLDADITQGKMSFPPASYDAFALVSVGATNNTQGLIYGYGSDIDRLDASDYDKAYLYHIAALATFYMLTRDSDDNGVNDFDHNGRRTGEEDTHLFPYSPRTDRDGNLLPKRGLGIDGPIYRIFK
ncbi:MAG: type II secretion system protein [Candidatus Hydrogenedentota bacterium]